MNHKGTFSILYERDIEDGEDEDEYNTKSLQSKVNVCEVKRVRRAGVYLRGKREKKYGINGKVRCIYQLQSCRG